MTKETENWKEIKKIITKIFPLMKEMHEPVNENLYMPEVIQSRVDRKYIENLEKNNNLTQKEDLILQDDFILNPYFQPSNLSLEELKEELFKEGILTRKD